MLLLILCPKVIIANVNEFTYIIAFTEVKKLIEKYCDYILGIFDKKDFYIDIIELMLNQL